MRGALELILRRRIGTSSLVRFGLKTDDLVTYPLHLP